MKKFNLALLGFFFGGWAVASDITLQHHNYVDLNVDAKDLTISIGYPGLSACSVELRSTRGFAAQGALQPLAEALSVTEGFNANQAKVLQGTPRGQFLRYTFAKKGAGRYVTRVRLATKSNETLAQAVARTLPKSIHLDPPVRVIVQLVHCE